MKHTHSIFARATLTPGPWESGASVGLASVPPLPDAARTRPALVITPHPATSEANVYLQLALSVPIIAHYLGMALMASYAGRVVPSGLVMAHQYCSSWGVHQCGEI